MAANWTPGELVQSLTYREAYLPPVAPRPAPASPHLFAGLVESAPTPLRTAAGAGWALVSLVTAGSVAVIVVVLLVRVVGILM